MFLLRRVPFIFSILTCLIANTYMITSIDISYQYKEIIKTFLSVNFITTLTLASFCLSVFFYPSFLKFFNLIYLVVTMFWLGFTKGFLETTSLVISILHVMYYTYSIDKRIIKREQNKLMTREIVWDKIPSIETHQLKVDVMFFLQEIVDYIKSLSVEYDTILLRNSLKYLFSKWKFITCILISSCVAIQLQTFIFLNFNTKYIIQSVLACIAYCGLLNFYVQISIFFLKKYIITDKCYNFHFNIKNMVISLFSYVLIVGDSSNDSISGIENILVVLGYFYMILVNRFVNSDLTKGLVKNGALLYSNTFMYSLIMISISLSLIENNKT